MFCQGVITLCFVIDISTVVTLVGSTTPRVRCADNPFCFFYRMTRIVLMVRDVLSSGDCHRNDTQCVQGTCTRTCTGTGETCGATGWVCEDSLCVKSCNIKQDCHYSQVS